MQSSDYLQKDMEMQIRDFISRIFGYTPFSFTTSVSGKLLKVCVSYQDFITDGKLLRLLRDKSYDQQIKWEVNRTMSDHTRNNILEDLFNHPERLYKDCSLNGNVRRYVFECFTITDFCNDFELAKKT